MLWDLPGGGFPIAVIHEEMRAAGLAVPQPPSHEVSRMQALEALWAAAGLREVALRSITVSRRFPDFATFWSTSIEGPAMSAAMAGMPADEAEALRLRVLGRLPADASGAVTLTATANAVKGLKPRSIHRQPRHRPSLRIMARIQARRRMAIAARPRSSDTWRGAGMVGAQAASASGNRHMIEFRSTFFA